MKNALLLVILIIVGSCTSNTIFKKPDDLIPKEEMVALLTDLYIASAARSSRNLEKQRNEDYTFIVFERHGIDSTRFKRSNFYYTTKIDEYEAIYKEVEKNISALNDKYQGLKKVKDSIRKDSIAKLRKRQDSIKNAVKDSLLIHKNKDSLKPILNKDSIKSAE